MSDPNMNKVANFWHSYERAVNPGHFAIVKSHFSGQPESVTDHRGESANSNDVYLHPDGLMGHDKESLEHLKNTKFQYANKFMQANEVLPHLDEYAKKVQAEILQDKSMPKRYFHGEPHIKLYRGVGGHYGKAIKDAVKHNPDTNEVEDKKVKLPTAHLTSWTTDPKMAADFAYTRGFAQGQPDDHGVVMSKWVPLKQVMHSGNHSPIEGQEHAHEREREIIVGHPTSSFNINSKNLKFQTKPQRDDKGKIKNRGEVADAVSKMKKSELEKGQRGNWQQEGYTIHHSNLGPEDHEGWSALHAGIKNGLKGGIYAREPSSEYGSGEYHTFESFPQLHNDVKAGRKTLDGMSPFVYAKDSKGNIIGGVHADDTPEILNTYVHPDHQRKGLASAMYNHLQKLSGRTIREGGSQTEAAKGLWLQPNRPFGKSENKHLGSSLESFLAEDLEKIEQKFAGIRFFKPLIKDDYSIVATQNINSMIREEQIHDLSHYGHFTTDSFIVGEDPKDSWLLKLEPKNKPGVKSLKDTGPQFIKEACFYKLAHAVFGLVDFIPHSVMGEIQKDGKPHYAVAIKMLPDDYKIAQDLEDDAEQKFKELIGELTRNGVIHKISAMFYILGEADSHGGNVMTNGKGLQMIDHGSSFANLAFDPSKDSDIFIPYILRVENDVKSNAVPEVKFKGLPRIKNPKVAEELREWILHLDPNKIKELMLKYGLDSNPELYRLEEIKELVKQAKFPDSLINSIWVWGLEAVKDAIKSKS